MKRADRRLMWAGGLAFLGWALFGGPLPNGTSAVALVTEHGPTLLVINGKQVGSRVSLAGVDVYVDRQPCGSIDFAGAPRDADANVIYRLDGQNLPAKCADDGAHLHLFARPGGGLLQSHPEVNAGGETYYSQLGPEPTDTRWPAYFDGGMSPVHNPSAWPYLGVFAFAGAMVLLSALLLAWRRASL